MNKPPSGIAILDSLSGQIYSNQPEDIAILSGIQKEEILDLTFQDITHPDDLQADLDHMQTTSGWPN